MIIILISIIIRFPGVWLLPVDDEAMWVIATAGYEPQFMLIPHPPVSIFIYSAFQFFFGHSYHIIRLTALMFGILTIVTTYYIAREMYGHKIAFLSVLILAISFYSILGSIQIDIDGSILSFLLAITLYFYMVHIKNGRISYLMLASILFGISLLTKYVSILIVPIMFAYLVTSKRAKLASMLFFVIIGGFIVLMFPAVSYLTGNWDIFANTLAWGQKNLAHNNLSYLLVSVISHLYRIVQYATPLFLLFPLCAYFKKEKREENLLYFWIVIVFLFYSFVVPGGNVSRYFMVIIPPLAILSARAFYALFGDPRTNDLIRMAVLTLIMFLMIALQNSFSATVEPFTLERGNFDILSKNPDIWYSSTSGPIFRVSAYSFIFVLIGSILLSVAYIFNKRHRRKILMLFISLNLAFNFFLTEELLFHAYSPNYNVLMVDMVSYYKDNHLPEPLYSINEDFANLITNGSYYDLESTAVRSTLGKEGGTAVIMNLPKTMSLTDDSYISSYIIRTVDEKCVLLKIFYLGEYDAGYIYRC